MLVKVSSGNLAIFNYFYRSQSAAADYFELKTKVSQSSAALGLLAPDAIRLGGSSG